MSSQQAFNHLINHFNANSDAQFDEHVALLVNIKLEDILLKYFFGTARKQFTLISIDFQKTITKKQTDTHILVPQAIALANDRWTYWYQLGLQLSAAISRAKHLNTQHDYTTVQLRGSFNVILFETQTPKSMDRSRRRRRPASTPTIQFAAMVEKYFRSVFNATHISAGFGLEDSDEENEQDEDRDDKMKDVSASRQLMETFKSVCVQLRALCWINRLEPAFTSVLYEKLEMHIELRKRVKLSGN
mgnify:FL=1